MSPHGKGPLHQLERRSLDQHGRGDPHPCRDPLRLSPGPDRDGRASAAGDPGIYRLHPRGATRIDPMSSSSAGSVLITLGSASSSVGVLVSLGVRLVRASSGRHADRAGDGAGIHPVRLDDRDLDRLEPHVLPHPAVLLARSLRGPPLAALRAGFAPEAIQPLRLRSGGIAARPLAARDDCWESLWALLLSDEQSCGSTKPAPLVGTCLSLPRWSGSGP